MTSPPIAVALSGGEIVLDAGGAPHVQATVRVVAPSAGVLALLDPRSSARVEVAAQRDGGTVRRFDLGVRSRPRRLANGEVSLSLASDEALLGDYRALRDDASPVAYTRLVDVVNYVLALAIPGARLTGSGLWRAVGDDAHADALVWRAGVTALDFLSPLVQARGLRLVCDEQRVWTLRGETYAGHGDGVVTVGWGVDLIDTEDTIDRGSGEWFDAAVVRYTWTQDGLEQTATDAHALTHPPTRVQLIEKETPFPGAGLASYAVRRAQHRGRQVRAVKVADWTATAEETVILTVPDEIHVGSADQVRFDLDRDEMTVTARTVDTPDTAWILLPSGDAWDDSPAGESWTDEDA
ncbi:hypothetical protein [Microbacterium sp. RG1]|uniref:hypothetical protein n=1 Tax=Microbacterium sp. RG1 TaxID=2489212 RepID=UPI0010CA4321|nr:hypothetical protein [Microbacterium sp. RG1]QCQ16984.1 hypothetical protein EHF32_09780 [Microbacterium sp. RG1]